MFAAEHLYITAIGNAFGTAERWQFGLRATPSGTVTAEEVAVTLSAIYEDWATDTAAFSTDSYNMLPTHNLSELKVAWVGPDGKYPEGKDPYSHFYLPPVGKTTGAVPAALPQNSFVATLTTAKVRGLGSKGRIYLPPSGWMSLGTDGRIAAATAAQIARNIKTLILGINATTPIGQVQVMSKGKGVATFNAEKKRVEWDYPNPGVSNDVTGVRVGRVVDTVRRRRRQLVEAPEVAPL